MAADPTLTDILDKDELSGNDEAPNMDDFTLPVTTSSPSIGTISANADNPQKPTGNFDGCLVQQTSTENSSFEKSHFSFKQPLEGTKDITGSGFSTLAPMVVDGAADQIERLQEEYRQKLNNSSNDAESACFIDVMKILENALSYKNSFLKEELEIAQQRAIQGPENNDESAAATVMKDLTSREPILERNIDNLLSAAKRVEELHEQAAGLIRQISTLETLELTPKPRDAFKAALKQIEEEKANRRLTKEEEEKAKNILTPKEQAQKVLKTTQEAIADELIYSENVKEGNSLGANFIKNKNAYLISKAGYRRGLYVHQYNQMKAEGRAEETRNFYDAFVEASNAGKSFESAAERDISEQARDAYIKSGNYYLQASELFAAEEDKKATNLSSAGEYFFSAAELFKNADKKGISQQASDLCIQAGDDHLWVAKLFAEEKDEEARKFQNIALNTQRAAISFKDASDPRTRQDPPNPQEAQDAYIKAGNAHLEAAKLFREGKDEEAEKFQNVALNTYKAGKSFEYFSNYRKSEDAQYAYRKAFNYYLQAAKLFAEKNEEAENFQEAASHAWKAGESFDSAYDLYSYDGKKDTLEEKGVKHLQRAELIAQMARTREQMARTREQMARTRIEAQAWHKRNQQEGRPRVWKGI